MKTISIFLSIAFLCLSCQKRAPLNLSLPPLEVLQKMESEQQSSRTSNSQSFIKGIESGTLKFQGSEGEFSYNLKELCPITTLHDGTLIFSCLRFSSQEALINFSQITLKDISVSPLLNSQDIWEYDMETFFYWPESKLLVPLAELTFRDGKNGFASTYKGEKGQGEAFFLLRLKKTIVLKGNKDQLQVWNNDKSLDLSEFDFWWQKREDHKRKIDVNFNKSLEIENLKLGSILEFDLLAYKISPVFSETMNKVQVTVDAESLPEQRRISNVSCDVVERYLSGKSESLIDLSRSYANLKLRISFGGKSYSLQDLLDWGKASIIYGEGRFKVQLKITDSEWLKNFSISVLPYEKFVREIGQIRFGQCRIKNVASYTVTQGLNKTLIEFSDEERYQGSYIIKESE